MNEDRTIAIARRPEPGQEEIALIRSMIAKDATGEEFQLFLEVCKRTGLNPLARQIYAIHRFDRMANTNKMTIQISIDGARLLAERTGKYAGQQGPWWCGPDGVWQEFWLSAEPPAAAKIGVLRHDFKEALYAVARFESYAGRTRDNKLMGLWAKMPEVMIAKVAEMLALRRGFPAELSGLYTTEEMTQADNPPALSPSTYEVVEERPARPAAPAPPAPRALSAQQDKASPAQLERIRLLRQQKGWTPLDVIKVCKKMFDLLPTDISAMQAEELAEYIAGPEPALPAEPTVRSLAELKRVTETLRAELGWTEIEVSEVCMGLFGKSYLDLTAAQVERVVADMQMVAANMKGGK